MTTTDFTLTLKVDQSPAEAFKAINNVRGWWLGEITGNTEKLNDEFNYRYKDIHVSTQKLVEIIPNKKVVWEVTNSNLSFLEEKDEWTGTKISFELAEKDEKTELRFTHYGLTPESECYEACFNGWSGLLKKNLFNLITGNGKPNMTEF